MFAFHSPKTSGNIKFTEFTEIKRQYSERVLFLYKGYIFLIF